MKKIVLFILSFAVATIAFAQTDAIKQYVDTYSEIAINEMMRTGVPAAITLAQGIVESQAGQSDLVKSSNNHFGIKCKDEWTGDCVYHDDDLKNECFRVYGSAEESFRDHSDFLKSRPYYTDLFNINPADYKAWARGLKKAGYATERDYPQMLIKMIEANGLQQYTVVALERMKNGSDVGYVANNNGSDVQQNVAASAATGDSSNAVGEQASHLQNAIDKMEQQQQPKPQPPVVAPPTANDAYVDTYPEGVFVINHRKVVYAHEGTSLLSLASKYDVSLALLLEFNELGKKNGILKEDRLIFLQRKLAKGEKEYHIVRKHERMEDIAQVEGVRLESLLQYNNMKKGVEPAAGRKIYLSQAVAAAHASKPSKFAGLAKSSKKKKHKQQSA
jgi:hypothetical protein